MPPSPERRGRRGHKTGCASFRMTYYFEFEAEICPGSVCLSAGVFIGHKKGCEAVSTNIRSNSGKSANPGCALRGCGSHQCRSAEKRG